MEHGRDLDKPDDEGKHTLGLAVSDSPHFSAQSYSCLVSEALPVCFCVRESDNVCVHACICVCVCPCVCRSGRGAS